MAFGAAAVRVARRRERKIEKERGGGKVRRKGADEGIRVAEGKSGKGSCG